MTGDLRITRTAIKVKLGPVFVCREMWGALAPRLKPHQFGPFFLCKKSDNNI